MAGNGPAPKDRRGRDRDNKALQELVYNGQVFGDPLPEGVLGFTEEGEPIPWHPQTVVWWESLRRWPLMQDEPAVSWMNMVDTARIHHLWWCGRLDLANEFRLRLANYGISPADRRRIGVKYKPYPEVPEAGESTTGVGKVTNLSSRRKRLTEE